jgi:hypothetical protein
MYLVSDPAKPAPFWVGVEELAGLNHDRRRVVGYAAPPGGESDLGTIDAECRRLGWRLVQVVWETGERTGLKRALELIANGEATGLLVVRPDSVADTAYEFANLLEWLAEMDASMVSAARRSSVPGQRRCGRG